MKRPVCCIDPTIPLLAEALQPFVRLYCLPGTELSPEILKRLRCHALFVRANTRVDAALVAGTPIRFVGTPSAGIDHIAVEELQQLGITVIHTPGCNANSVAEYVLVALLLWAAFPERRLSTERLGIIGFGNIGRRVASYARQLGMEVWVNDPPLARQGFRFPEWVVYAPTVRELCAACSAVSLHVPLMRSGPDATWHLLSYEELALLPQGSLLVQTSRGGVLDEAALEAILPEKRSVLALDVWEQEPSVNWHLVDHAVLATPHIAGYAWQARVRCSQKLVHHFAKWAGIVIPETPFLAALEYVPPPPTELPWTNPKELLKLLQQRRKLGEDTHSLRAWRRLSPSRQHHAFRTFRESYPRRYETLSLPEDSLPTCQ
ncbi:MAG: 4-phosphoerythronate dehydrogenase [Candidatus Kapabacteria bacterium]|nr:4-phosphoerythronate dehydrogenase [Candidatus Kapabacteria bacterium]MCS7169163.1 4-phosphoerythronate dehydrogenase [Candidatus Kapabacteria bacterium]MDW7997272.1 4-phosphoerythronate dehydrogenase [Bacteroidota bacterium]MDW8224451.1 4-phosphoerythronate dehydrogenase [Bacteroidota bacterium]